MHSYIRKYEELNLIFLIVAVGLALPEDLYQVIFSINRVSIPTRYPEDLKKMQKEYTKQKSGKLLMQSGESNHIQTAISSTGVYLFRIS